MPKFWRRRAAKLSSSPSDPHPPRHRAQPPHRPPPLRAPHAPWRRRDRMSQASLRAARARVPDLKPAISTAMPVPAQASRIAFTCAAPVSGRIAEDQRARRPSWQRCTRAKPFEIDSIEDDVDAARRDAVFGDQPMPTGIVDREIAANPGKHHRRVGPADPAVTHADRRDARKGQQRGQRLEPVMAVDDVRVARRVLRGRRRQGSCGCESRRRAVPAAGCRRRDDDRGAAGRSPNPARTARCRCDGPGPGWSAERAAARQAVTAQRHHRASATVSRARETSRPARRRRWRRARRRRTS